MIAIETDGAPADFFLNVLKPRRITSAKVVAAIKRAGSYRKVGHAGTLDPLAEGVLPVAVGKATRMIPFLHSWSKSYLGVVLFGVSTTTDDLEGEAVASTPAAPAPARIRAALHAMIGAHKQRPPSFAAARVGGRRAYRIARSGGQPVLAEREVTIHAAEVVCVEFWRSHAMEAAGLERFAGPESRGRLVAAIAVSCSTGTYIRAIARDLGIALGTGACLAGLCRTRVGPFGLAEACRLRDALHAIENGYVDRLGYGMDEPALHLPGAAVGGAGALQFLSGGAIDLGGRPGDCRIYDPLGRFLGIGLAGTEGRVSPRVVFAD